MNAHSWPDSLQSAQPEHSALLLETFWRTLAQLPALVERQENLLAADVTALLRHIVLEMMLALNGIDWPEGTMHLNSYLSESQRAAIEKTLLAPAVNADSWIGQAVALVVIYRWYAPQLATKYELIYPQAAEDAALAHLRTLLHWPLAIFTE
ncbi:MAG: hypothetical protein WAU00_04820 [Caldilinea sp.]